MRLFIFLVAVASLVLAFFLEPLLALTYKQGPEVILPTLGVIAMVFLVFFNCWVLFFSRSFDSIYARWVSIGVIVGLVTGLVAFDLAIKQDFSEVLELAAALLLFSLPTAITVALVCDWFPWRIVRKDAPA